MSEAIIKMTSSQFCLPEEAVMGGSKLNFYRLIGDRWAMFLENWKLVDCVVSS